MKDFLESSKSMDLENYAVCPLNTFFTYNQEEHFEMDCVSFRELINHPMVREYITRVNHKRYFEKKGTVLVDLMDTKVGETFNIRLYGVNLHVNRVNEEKNNE